MDGSRWPEVILQRMQVRAAKPEDALEVARVHVRAWQVGYPPEARALLAGALLKEAPAASNVAAIRTYGSVKLGDINGFRDRLKASLDASSGTLSAEGQKSAKVLPAAVT